MSAEEDKQEDVIPSWMDNKFFETALQTSERDPNLKVTSIEIERVAAPGCNYTSEMYRATVQMRRGVRPEERSLIVKAARRREGTNKLKTDGNSLELEATLLRDIIPEMYRLLEDILPGVCEPFAPKLIYSCHGPEKSAIVLEDLEKQGFRMAKVASGLNLDHCLHVVSTLARFHAASVAIRKRNPDIMEPFLQNEAHDEKDANFGNSFQSTFANVAKEVEKWPKDGEHYSNKILNLAANAGETYLAERARNEKDFNVLIHGDLWLNNMLFDYSVDSVYIKSLRFLDYKMSYWSSPVIDLHAFINSSACKSVSNKTHTLLVEYYQTLAEALPLFGCKNLLPSWNDFNDQFNKKGAYATICAIIIRRHALADRDRTPDMDNVSKVGEDFHCSDVYLESLKTVLPLLETKGWF